MELLVDLVKELLLVVLVCFSKLVDFVSLPSKLVYLIFLSSIFITTFCSKEKKHAFCFLSFFAVFFCSCSFDKNNPYPLFVFVQSLKLWRVLFIFNSNPLKDCVAFFLLVGYFGTLFQILTWTQMLEQCHLLNMEKFMC